MECTDGEFRSAEDVYFDTELVRKLLGEQVARARIPEKDGQALEDLLGWLGVSYRPHGVDIVSRVKKLVLEPMTPQLRLTIQEMIGQLGREWAKFADSSDDLQELKTLKWLPDTEGKEWQPPKAVYATFRQYLFSTQASFIDLPRAQERLSADFLSFLGVKAEPSLIQIVNHLISSAQRQVPINVEVYAELTRNADAPEIAKLRGEKCLHLKEFGYVSPTMVFWSSHPFGKYRIHLGQDWRVYTPFLTRVGVRDAPEPSDAAAVLFQIAEEFGPFHRILEEDSYNVVLRCWQLLSESLDQGHSCGDVIKNLRERKVIPDGRRILNKPDRIFFEDRPRLVEKFGDHLKDNVIARPQGGWPAMEQAGVRLLSEVIRIDLVECEDEQRDEEVDALLRSRRPLISRVLVGAGTDRLQSILLERLQVFRTSRLRIKYWIDGFGLNMPTPIEEVQAYLSRENDRLYIRRSSPPPWAAISRELSYALVSTDEPGRLAAGIKEVLEAGSDEEAASVLDDLGFAPLMVTTDLNQPEGPTGAVGGDKRAEAKDAIDDNASDEGAAAGGNGTGPRDGTEDGGGREKQSGRKGGNAPTGRTKGKRTEILRSYVRWEREGVGGAISPSQTEEEEGVASVGVSKVLEYEKRESRFPTRKPHNYPGYDIESRNAEGEIVRYIEVKSLSGEWTNVGAGMSKEQFGTAWIEEGKFWLYVVERASSTDAKLFAFKNPAHRVVDFRFDDGWRECADEQAILKRRSILDLKSDDQGSAPEENEEVEL